MAERTLTALYIGLLLSALFLYFLVVVALLLAATWGAFFTVLWLFSVL
jgi:hypothetical protein